MKRSGELHDRRAIALLTTYMFRVVPMNILAMEANGVVTVNKAAILDQREQFISLDTSKPFKLNAGNAGYCAFIFSECCYI